MKINISFIKRSAQLAMLLLPLAFALPNAAKAQTITIGTDTTTHCGAPISNLSKFSLTEMIFTAEEIGNTSTNQILSIGFYSTSDVIQSYSINIYMKNVGRDAFSSPDDYIKLSSADKVYYSQTDGKITPRAGWNTIELPTPFDYNPDSNLLIAVDKYVGSNGYGDSIWRYSSTASSSTYRMLYAEGSSWFLPVATATPTLELSHERPNIQINFDNSCAIPTDLSATLTPGNGTVATLTWNTSGIATNWVLQYGTDSTFATFTEIDSGFTVNGTSVTTNLTGLTPETPYYARVKPSCDTSNTLWSDMLAFIPTNAYPFTVFENGTYTNYYFPMYVHGTVSPNVCYNKSECIIPATELTGICDGTIRAMTFYASSVSNVSWENTYHKVFVKEVNYTTLGGSYSGLKDATIVFEGQLPEPTPGTEEYTITFQENYDYDGGNLLIGIYSINGTNGTVKWFGTSSTTAGVAAYGTSLYSWEDVNYYEYYQDRLSFLPKTTFSYFPTNIPKPRNLASNNITSSSATLTWTAPETESAIMGYLYSYKKASDADWSQEYSSASTSVTLDALDEQTLYEFRVCANYGDLGLSRYATTTFSTLEESEVPIPDYTDFTFNETTSTQVNLPFRSAYVQYGTYGQFIIPSDYLVDLAGGSIRRLTFYSSTASANWGNAGFSVKMAEVENSTFSSSNLVDWGTMTEVYNGSLSVANGQMVIDFDNNFTYNGGNLMIGFNEITTGTNMTVFWYGNSSHSNAAVYAYYSNATTTTLTQTLSSYLPKVTINYQPTPYQRVNGINVGTVTATTAQLIWTAPSPNVTGYQYQYKLATATEWPAEWENLTASSTSVTLSSLSPGSNHVFRIKAMYGDNESVVTTASFITDCPEYATTPFTENFDSYSVASAITPTTQVLPNCWDYINETTNNDMVYPSICYYQYTDYANSTPNYLKFYIENRYNNPQPQYAILPAVQNVNTTRVKFKARAYNTGSTYTNTIIVGVMEDTDATTFDTIQTITLESTAYTDYVVYLDNYEGDGNRIAIMMEVPSTRYGSVLIDNVTVEEIPSCIEPTNLEVTSNVQSATLTWVSSATSCQVAHATYANARPNNNIVGITEANAYTMDDLTIDKDHYFWVRSICGNNIYSEWTGPISIHIGYCVPNPTDRSNKGITGVTFGNGEYMVNNSNSNGLPSRSPYYGNYTDMVGAIQAGVQDTIKITTNTSYYDNSYWIKIWVDFDNSLSFDDDEIIYSGWGWDYGEGTLNATITIPAAQSAGDYRMRIGGCEYLQNEHDPCMSGDIKAGYHDYTLRVLETPSIVFTKEIAGYIDEGGWYLIASPVASISPDSIAGMTVGDYDLYAFDQYQELEWRNYKTEDVSFNLESGKGYLYARNADTTLTFEGMPYSGNGEIALSYDANDERKCWNLVGNPFDSEAYLDREYYVMKADGTGINPVAVSATMPIPPCTALFVKAVANGDKAVFTKVIR